MVSQWTCSLLEGYHIAFCGALAKRRTASWQLSKDNEQRLHETRCSLVLGMLIYVALVQREYLTILHASFRGGSGKASSPYLSGQTVTLSLKSHCPMHGQWEAWLFDGMVPSFFSYLHPLRCVRELKAWESLNNVLTFWWHSGFKRRVIGDLGYFSLISLKKNGFPTAP